MLVQVILAVHVFSPYIILSVTSHPFRVSQSTRCYSRDVMTDEAIGGKPIITSICKHQNVFHVMGADISTEQEGVFRLRITRPESEAAFSDQDKALCQMLLPHMRSALQVRSLLGRSESMGNLYADAINRLSVATILLNDKGVVQKLNEYAQALLDRADGLKLVGDRLEASYPSDNKELQKRIKYAFDARERGATLSGEPLSVTRPSGEVNLGIGFEAVPNVGWLDDKDRGRPCCCMCGMRVNKSNVSSSVAKELFDFTPAETTFSP